MRVDIDEIPPQALDAEQSVLGALLIEPERYSRVSAVVERSDFHRESHRDIFYAIGWLTKRKEPVDIRTVTEVLRAGKRLEACGGVPYIVGLTDKVELTKSAEYMAGLVKDAAIRRAVISTAKAAIEAAHDPEVSALEIISAVMSETRDACNRAVGHGEARRLRDTADEMFLDAETRAQNGSPPVGISYGFDRLTYLLGGAEPGQLIVIGARPGGGKSALLFQFAQSSARRGHKSLLVSLEMSEREATRRIAAQISGVDGRKIKTADMTADEWADYGRATAVMQETELCIIDKARMSVDELGARVQQYDGCAALFVDYLQKLRGPRGVKRNEEVAYIANELKAVAKDNGIPVFVAAQVNRETDRSKTHEPTMADLLESGAIEAAADHIIMLWRDADIDEAQIVYDMHCKVAKARDAQTGYVPMQYRPACTRFEPRGDAYR